MNLKVATTIAETRQAIVDARARGLTVGLVPTMGALHEGHASLIRAARQETGFVVVSVFVNPTQFGPHEDLTRYPRPFDQDVALCEREKVDLIFHPDVPELYPTGFDTYVEVGKLANVLCGASRPGHFRGVATVVLKLFNIVQPDVAYFGRKDAQQLRILEQMVSDFNLPVTLRPCPIVREADGLALSSRNVYLDAEQRRNATGLFRALSSVQRDVDRPTLDTYPMLHAMKDRIEGTPGARLDYATIVDYQTLQPIEKLKGKCLVAVAAYFGTTRLIDNLYLELPE